ncbi:nuclear transport factor 2 family protein [Kitasatospora sp. NPDC054795]
MGRHGRLPAPDAAIRLCWFNGSGAEFIAAARQMSARGDAATHFLSPPIVDVVDDRALVGIGAAIHIRGDVNGIEADLTSHVRLLYRVERRAGTWVIVSLDPVYEHDSLVPAVPGDSIRLDAGVLERARPSYRMLTCMLASKGYTVANDLHGNDRPEPVRQLYRTLNNWLSADAGSTSA